MQSKQKDLEDENNELRKKNLKLLEEMDIQKKQLSAKLIEEQQIRSSKEKAIENIKVSSIIFIRQNSSILNYSIVNYLYVIVKIFYNLLMFVRKSSFNNSTIYNILSRLPYC